MSFGILAKNIIGEADRKGMWIKRRVCSKGPASWELLGSCLGHLHPCRMSLLLCHQVGLFDDTLKGYLKHIQLSTYKWS